MGGLSPTGGIRLRNLFQRVQVFLPQLLPTLTWSTLLTLLTESLSRGSVVDAFTWSVFHPILLLQNLLLLGGLLALVGRLTNRPALATGIVGGVVGVLGYANGVKMRVLGVPLLARDLTLVGEAWQVFPLRAVLDRSGLAAALFFISPVVMLIRAVPLPSGLTRTERIRGGLLALLVVLLFGLLPLDSVENVRHSGYLRTLTAWAPASFAESVGPVHAESMLPESDTVPAVSPDRAGVRPDIVVILNESFWDPTKLTNVTFSRDPLPFYHSLLAQHSNGWMLSPRYGGMTANVELEVLTGVTMRPFPEVILYEHLKKPVDSLASILRREGYRSTVISPWSSAYFHADEAYRLLGFSNLISLEFMADEKNGPLMADQYIARLIMEETEKGASPHFLFVNTAENHWPYYPGKFPKREIEVRGVTGEAKGLIETYSQGVLDADRMLQMLVEHYRTSTRPTMLVMFGDHLPALGNDFLAYKAAGYMKSEKEPDFLEKMYRVPVVVWTNYLSGTPDSIDFSTSFLGPYLLEKAGIPGTRFTAWLSDLSRQHPTTPLRERGEARGIRRSDLQLYEEISQALMAGGERVYPEVLDRIVDPGFVLGYGPLRIDQVTARTEGGEKQLFVAGENLPPTGRVFLNKTPLKTRWLDSRTLVAAVPATLFAQNEWEVEVRVLDAEQKKSLVVSNPIQTGPHSQLVCNEPDQDCTR